MELLKGLLEVICIGWEKGGRYFNGSCDNEHQLGHAWRHCVEMSDQDKIAFAAKKGDQLQGSPREAVKIKVANEAGMAARAGTTERVSEINSGARAGSSVGTGPMARASGKGFERDGRQRLGLGRRGTNLLTAGPALAQKDNQMECHAGAHVNLPEAVHGNPVPGQNRFMQNQFP